MVFYPEREHVISLISRASSDIPADVRTALEGSLDVAAGNAAVIVHEILDNCALASCQQVPICQDTGIPTFYVSGPVDMDRALLIEVVTSAVRDCVKSGILRPNAADALTGINTGDGTGDGIPQVYFDCAETPTITVDLLLKGGGCENAGIQYSLPDLTLGAGRDIEGVRKCVIDAAFQAQGAGCAPGILGVCIGGDRATGYAVAKRQLMRPLVEDGTPGQFAGLEASLLESINSLGIGPMGLGGFPTLLGVKIHAVSRHPASFFVSVSYGCWATRRRRLSVVSDGGWLVT